MADEPYKGYDSYYLWLTAMFRSKRTLLASGPKRTGMVPMAGQVMLI